MVGISITVKKTILVTSKGRLTSIVTLFFSNGMQSLQTKFHQFSGDWPFCTIASFPSPSAVKSEWSRVVEFWIYNLSWVYFD